MRSLNGAVKLSALLHEPCAPDLASVHTGRNSVAFSQSEESMWLVHQMVLSRKVPNSVTSSHEQNQAYIQQVWQYWVPIENNAWVFESCLA